MSVNLPLFELALVLVRFNRVAVRVVNRRESAHRARPTDSSLKAKSATGFTSRWTVTSTSTGLWMCSARSLKKYLNSGG